MFRLVFHLSGNLDHPVPLPETSALTLGRGDDVSIRLEHATISRQHARLNPAPDGAWSIEDLQSRNGIRLNGVPLPRPQPLAAGDRVIFGDLEATFRAAPPEERAADAARDAESDPAVGCTFAARYRLRALHTETAESVGYRAADLALDPRPVAVHVFRPGIVEAAGGFEAMKARYDAVRAAPAHPNLATPLDFALWRGTAYLVSAWTDGYPLFDTLGRRGPLKVEEALLFAHQAAAVTTHARAHRLPSPDLGSPATCIFFDPPLAKPKVWPKLLHKPVGRWPAFTLKIMPRLAAPDPGYAFGTLLLELLGATPGTTVPGARPVPVHVPSLGERGNEVLARGLSSRGEAFGGDAAFVALLARAVDPRG